MISLQRVTKKYGNFKAVDELSFVIKRNEIFGLLGPNGAGKTTTIRMICGLLAPTAGKITISSSSDKQMIGYCPQENIFYPKLTCLEQIIFIGEMYGLSSRNARQSGKRILTDLGLYDKADRLAGNLSGGMKRRLNIALALIHSPEVLVLDEPEAGLDPQSRVLVRDFIRHFGNTKTVVITTHNMDEADRLADRIAIMDHGNLLLLDTPENLKKSIGEGELLEIAFESERDLQKLNDLGDHLIPVKKTPTTLVFKGHHISNYIPEIKSAADHAGVTISEIRLRENTLEDVFIHLTGRKLRE